MPAITVQQQVNQILQQLGNIQQQVNNLQAGQDLLPMQLHNAVASFNAPLHYPINIPIPAQAPQNKWELLQLTGANCQIVAQALNLPALPHNTSIAQRRQQVIDYLGCCITL